MARIRVFTRAHEGRGLGEIDTASHGVCRAGERKVGGSRTDSILLDEILPAVSAVKVARQVPAFAIFHLLVWMLTERMAPLGFPMSLDVSGLLLCTAVT